MKTCIIRAILAMACIAVMASTAGAGKFSPALQMDTYTDASRANESFGSKDNLWVTSESGNPVRIAYLTFAGINTPPEQISSGSLKIYVKEVERPGKVNLYLYDHVVMNTVTWADRPAEYGPDIVGTLDIQGPGWQTWDVTTFVEKAAVECSRGCPFSVVLVGEGNVSIGIASMESTPTEKLVLQYEAS